MHFNVFLITHVCTFYGSRFVNELLSINVCMLETEKRQLISRSKKYGTTKLVYRKWLVISIDDVFIEHLKDFLKHLRSPILTFFIFIYFHFNTIL